MESIRDRFVASCHEALRLGAEVIIRGDGVLNEVLVRHKLLHVDGAVVLDCLGVLYHHAAFLARARAARVLDVSRRQLYAKPTIAMLSHIQNFSGALRRSEADFSGALEN